jgi:uncharacterized protein YjiS (DUF1127 family)
MSNHAIETFASREIGFMTNGHDAGLMARFGRKAAETWNAYRAWSDMRRASRHLASMDDRLLRDIGVSRSEINRMVYGPVYAAKVDHAVR